MRIFTFIFCSCLFTSLAQETSNFNEEPTSLKHSLGLHAGFSTGQGFSYRFFPKKWGVQVTGIPVFNGNNSFFTSSAVSILYKIKEHKKVDLFTYLGNHLIFRRFESLYGIDPWLGEENFYISETTYNIALGAGVNIHLWHVLDLSIQAGYGLSSFNNSRLTTIFSSEIGLYYKF